MPSLPPVSSYKPQSRRTQMGNGKGTGVARLIGKKRHVDSDDSDSPEYQTVIQAFKKPKSEQTLTLDFLGSGSESDGDFNPTMKALYEANAQKMTGNMGGEYNDSYMLSYEQNKIDTHSVSREKGCTTNVGNDNQGGQTKAPSRAKTGSEDNGYAAEMEDAVPVHQNRLGVKGKSDKRVNENSYKIPKTRSKGKTISRQ